MHQESLPTTFAIGLVLAGTLVLAGCSEDTGSGNANGGATADVSDTHGGPTPGPVDTGGDGSEDEPLDTAEGEDSSSGGDTEQPPTDTTSGETADGDTSPDGASPDDARDTTDDADGEQTDGDSGGTDSGPVDTGPSDGGDADDNDADSSDTDGGEADDANTDVAQETDAITCPDPDDPDPGEFCLQVITCCVHQPSGTKCTYNDSCAVPESLEQDPDWDCDPSNC